MELQLSELQGPDQSLDWCRGLEDTSVQRSALLGQHRVLAWPCAVRGVCAGSRFRLFQGEALVVESKILIKTPSWASKKRKKKSTLFSFSLSFWMFFKISFFKTLKKMTGVLAVSEICLSLPVKDFLLSRNSPKEGSRLARGEDLEGCGGKEGHCLCGQLLL